jgi:hypothetical protein
MFFGTVKKVYSHVVEWATDDYLKRSKQSRDLKARKALIYLGKYTVILTLKRVEFYMYDKFENKEKFTSNMNKDLQNKLLI